MDDQKPSALTPINNPKHRNMPEERRCVAHKKTGERCQRPAILGATVCRSHGGAAPHVKRAAQARLANATDRMAFLLLGMATDENMRPDLRLQAIKEVLDRGGIAAKQALAIEHEMGPRYQEMFDHLHRGGFGAQRSAPDVVDGEIVGNAEFDDGREP